MNEFRKIMKHYRIDNEISMADMAKKMGVSTSYLSHMETGMRKLTPTFADKVFENFDLSEEDKEIISKIVIENRSEIVIKLESLDKNKQEIVKLFYSKLQTLSKDQEFYIEKILNGYLIDELNGML